MINPIGHKPRIRSFNPDYTMAIQYALGRLQNELSPLLTYHNLWHTETIVLPGVTRLADLLHLCEEERHLTEVAAAFHDIGFVNTFKDHELAGIGIAKQALPGFGFNDDQIRQVTGMILATRLPQNPHTLCEKVLAAADLDVLGRDDFFEQNDALRREVQSLGKNISLYEWLQWQVNFISGHRYFTEEVTSLREITKQKNLLTMNEWLRHAQVDRSVI